MSRLSIQGKRRGARLPASTIINVKILRGPWNEELFRFLEGFPDLAHDDEVDACSGALEMLNVQMKGAAIFEFYRQKAEKLKQPTTTIWVRLRAPPPGTGSVQIFTNHYNMRPDGTFEVLAEDAEILIRRGSTKSQKAAKTQPDAL